MESTPQTQISRPGRPVGSTILDRESFLQQSVDAYRKSLDKWEKHPSQHYVAGELLIARATLNRYFKLFNVSWGKIRQLGMQKWLEEEKF